MISAYGKIFPGQKLYNSEGRFYAEILAVESEEIQLKYYDGIILWVNRNAVRNYFTKE